jgi:hypothetical protein
MEQKQSGLIGYHLCQSIKHQQSDDSRLDSSLLSLTGFVSQDQYNLAVILYHHLVDRNIDDTKQLMAVEQWFIQLIEPPPSDSIELLDIWFDHQKRRCTGENRFRSKTQKRIPVSIQLRMTLSKQLPAMEKMYKTMLCKLIN